MFDEYGMTWQSDYFLPEEPQPMSTSGEGGFFSGFFDAASNKLLSNVQSSLPSAEQFGSSLFDVVYAYSRGSIDQAREKLVSGVLQTKEGQRLQAVGMRQTLEQYMPHIILAVIAILALGYFAGKR